MNPKLIFLSLFFFLCFLLIGILSLNDYGISWDEPEHFNRGQAYFLYFLKGEKDYSSLKIYDLNEARVNPNYHERSFYQRDSMNYRIWLIKDSDHPPLNGILASLTNYIFYQKLGLVGDIEGYHLFNIFISSILVALVFLFAAESFGILAGVFAAIFMATYPLFFGESRFNIKDPAETTFILLTLYFFWKAIHYKKSIFIFFSSIAAGLALSIKFNIFFVAPILFLWILITLIFGKRKEILSFFLLKKTLITLLLFPFVMLFILVAIWPFLWQDLYGHLSGLFGYYKDIGTEEKISTNSNFVNLYASKWILFTTPPLVLASFVVGLLLKNYSKKSFVVILWLILFLITLIRVSLPEATIYGGVRQIMEYIPAMCLIAGVGASFVVHILSKRLRVNLELASIFAISIVSFFLIIPLIRLHPNQNVYFNFLIGGLKGAVEKKIPSAGNSFGNAYIQGIEWLNIHAAPNSKLALIQGTSPNLPVYKVGPNIDYSNTNWSALNRGGEYLMEVTYNQEFRAYYYAWEYVEKMLEPVYEVKADGVPILKIWKNDLAHTKLKYRKPEVVYSGGFDFKVDEAEVNTFLISLPKEVTLTRVSIPFSPSPGCIEFKNGSVETSKDGKDWFRELDPVSLYQFGSRENFKENTFEYLFAAREAKYIEITVKDINACILNNPNLEIKVLE